MACDTSCCDNRAQQVGSKAAKKDEALSCWAFVDGGDVWVWDVEGKTVLFSLPPGHASSWKNHHPADHLCFASHTNQNVDDLLTPCFEQGGRHGVPDEDCFCGEEEPHLHAHWDGAQTSTHLVDEERLASVVLSECQQDSSILKEQYGWPCSNLRHLIQQRSGAPRLGDINCAECNHKKTSSGKPPSFHLLGKRMWTDMETRRPVTLRFYTSGQEEEEKAECPCDYIDCPCEEDPTSWACCSSNKTDVSGTCCSGSSRVDASPCCASRAQKNACCPPSSELASGTCNRSTISHCSGKEEESSQQADECCPNKTDCEKEQFSAMEEMKSSKCCEKDKGSSSPCCAEESPPGIGGCCESSRASSQRKCCVSEEASVGDAAALNCCNKEASCRAASDCQKMKTGCPSSCCDTQPACEADGEKSCCTKNTNRPLSNEKFPDTSKPDQTISGRSELFVNYLCCASEIPAVHGTLDGTPGIRKISVNPVTKTVYVHHETSTISADQIAELLNRQGMGAEVKVDAAKSRESHRQSLFVVSKYKVESENMDKDRLELVLKTVDETKIESFAFDERGGILTVIHNPWTIDTQEIAAEIQHAGVAKVEVILNGSDQNQSPLDYAALAASNASLTDGEDTESNPLSSTWPKPNVIVSGILWIVSMLSFINENLEPLKYVALVSVAFGLPPIARKAIGTFRQQFKFDANGLMLLASIGALALGEFPEAGAVVFLFALSQWLEERASSRARRALSAIVRLRPLTARLIDPETQQLWDVPAVAVPVGALVAVKTGDQVPCDGVVVEGETTVDESSLTGESRPIRKAPKDTVSGGTVNTGVRQLVVRTTATANDSAVSRLIRLVEEAQMNRSETEKSIDEFARIYTPVVMFAAVLMCSVPWAIDAETGRKWAHNGLVLIVLACPCALIISTPVVYVAGLAATAQKGILVKGGAFLEALGQLSHICFDKTGTLTNGEFCLLHLDMVGGRVPRQSILEYLLLMEERASHPVAQAIISAARNEGVIIPKDMVLEKHTILAGEGVTGVINGTDVFVGNERLFDRMGLLAGLSDEEDRRVNSWKRLGGTIGFISVAPFGIVGAYCAADAVRPEAASVVASFKKRRIALSMLTGDNEEAAQSVGTQLGWDGDLNEIRAKLLPADKLQYVEELTAQSATHSSVCGRKKLVLFCGDGVNDAPALAAADVGVAMGSGATVAMETAHVTLLDPSLRKLEFAYDMGRCVRAKITQNVVFSLAVKAVFLVWALVGSPSLWAAIASDVGSMLIVTLNAMRLLPSRAPMQRTIHSINVDTRKSV